jgi:hypothetical protein
MYAFTMLRARSLPTRHAGFLARLCALAGALLAAGPALAQPVIEAWAVTTPSTPTAVAAAPVGGLFAVADSQQDRVEFRDRDQSLRASVTRSQIAALLPWMSLGTSADGPSAVALSDSGRLAFIAVHDANAASDGQGSDAILRLDTETGDLSVFARFEFSSTDAIARPPGLAFFRGRLYVGLTGSIRVYRALANDRVNAPVQFTSSPAAAAGHVVEAIAIDRLTNTLYAAWNNTLNRSAIGTSSLTFSTVGTLTGARALAWSDHFGGTGQSGLFALDSATGPDTARVYRLPPAMARGTQAFSPLTYLTTSAFWRGLAATPDGRLLTSAADAAVVVRDASDTRLSELAWRADEFQQHVALARGLISPDGEPAGWVIDADVIPSWSRFHPATPDAAAWVVLVLLMNDYLTGDPQAIEDVRLILRRYAGLMPDGIAPSRNPDGIFRHWIDPLTGGVKPGGWDPEFATLSTMKIVLAAARAKAFYPGDQAIAEAAEAIICGVSNWDAYVNPTTLRMSYKGLPGGGPDNTSTAGPFMEGIIFVEQIARLGTGTVAGVYDVGWLTRALWPTATYVTGRPVTGDIINAHRPAFLTIYPLLTQADFRARSDWQTQVANVRLSHMAWTDDNGPVWSTVFSAGTTKDIWGGYHADAIGDNPGNVTTFPALLALAAGTGSGGGYNPAATAAYQAYRVGARQTFKSGASLLYRRSSIDPAYLPNSAGLPDVTMGALGLAELLAPGSVQAVLTGTYPTCGALPCTLDYNADTFLNLDDLGDFITDFYADPPIPGRRQPAAPTMPDQLVGFGTPCRFAGDAASPYAAGAYRASGFRVGFSPDASNDCPLDPLQSFPNLDNLNDYITAYYATFAAGC